MFIVSWPLIAIAIAVAQGVRLSQIVTGINGV